MIAQSDLERERYEARLKLQRDISTALAEARDEGLKQGIERGIEEGIERGIERGIKQGIERGRKEGQVVGQIHFCQRLLGRAQTPEPELLALPLAELERLAQELEAEVSRSP